MTKRTTTLKRLLTSPEPSILMEAHSGLSAKLAQEAGFEALWASGLAISATHGVRDNNEASWTQVLELLEFMSDSTELPILVDGDTGYGNFNNVQRLVRKLEQRNIAGVCIEDKLFPKTNSFIDGEKQALAQIDEFCGKIRAAKDAQTDADFVVVARTEAFIAGWGVDEALLRANAYVESGADLVLVHSKRRDSSEILSFAKQWDHRIPLVIVPTKYPSEPLSTFVQAKITNFIFANQSVRTVVSALQRNLRRLRETGDLMSIEHEIAPVDELFRLQDVKGLKESERQYLPKSANNVRAIVLGASQGQLGRLVRDRAKCMVQVEGKPILAWNVEALRRRNVREIAVVRGFRKEAVNLDGLRYFDNDEYASTGELYSLFKAQRFMDGDLVVSYGDILFDDFILQNLMNHSGDIKIAVDLSWKLRTRNDTARDLVYTSGVSDPLGNGGCMLKAVGGRITTEEADGEWIGLLYCRANKTQLVLDLLKNMERTDMDGLRTATVPDLLNKLVEIGEAVSVVHSYGHWQDLDIEQDLVEAQRYASHVLG